MHYKDQNKGGILRRTKSDKPEFTEVNEDLEDKSTKKAPFIVIRTRTRDQKINTSAGKACAKRELKSRPHRRKGS